MESRSTLVSAKTGKCFANNFWEHILHFIDEGVHVQADADAVHNFYNFIISPSFHRALYITAVFLFTNKYI